MTITELSPKQRLIAALERSDSALREERADRIVWMSTHNQRPSVVMGSSEALCILDEAEAAFREGQFISVILLAQALIEHELVDELVRRTGKAGNYGASLSRALKFAKEHRVLDEDIISRIDQLRLIRNPFAHLKKPDHPHSYGNRFRTEKIYPKALLQQDAREAFKIMYEVFRALLRETA